MSRRQKSSSEENQEPVKRDYELIVVGGGSAGLLALEKMVRSTEEISALCLEVSDRLGGRASSGFHLMPSSRHSQLEENSVFEWGPVYPSARVRWEREWKDPSEVDWQHKDWLVCLPQWFEYFREPQIFFAARSPDLTRYPSTHFQLRCPVSRVERVQRAESQEWVWECESPEGIFRAPELVWAAGLAAFQNAFGKTEAQRYLVENESYRMEAADFRGGVSLNFHFAQKPLFEDQFPAESLWALPVKHNGKYSLLLGCLKEEAQGWTLYTLTHVSRDVLSQPQDVLSLQKSLRRGLKSLLIQEEGAITPTYQESWVVSDRVGGHRLGSPALLKNAASERLFFVGDESLEKTSIDSMGQVASEEPTPASVF